MKKTIRGILCKELKMLSRRLAFNDVALLWNFWTLEASNFRHVASATKSAWRISIVSKTIDELVVNESEGTF